ncbi:MAG: hypothetical protein LBK60_04565 [Verrucomicrobiales bacterium]|jgi:hypothetical protein|nr:hypothetical protein [Verrucomicrobiales bacterium]
MKTHERFVAAATGRPLDRLPVIEWASWWEQTLDRWRSEQPAARDLTTGVDWQRHFGLDVQLQSWFPTMTAATPQPATHGAPIVSGLDEYRNIRPTLFPELRLDEDYLKLARQLYADGAGVAWYTLEGFFWFPRQLLGIENHLYSFYDEPELYHTICRDLLAWQKKVVAYCRAQFPFTFMTFAEDLSYNNGPMISREIFAEFLAPYYREIVPLIRQTGTLTVVDSNGDIAQATGWFGACGLDGMLPLERQAGVEVSLYLDHQPGMFFLGHFDKMVMHQGRAALEREFARLLPSARRGRFIPSVDHQTPPAVSYDDYRLYVSLLKQFAVDAAERP